MKTALALLTLRLRQARAGRLPWLAAVQLLLVAGVLLFVPAPTPGQGLRLALSISLTLAGLIAAVGGVAFGASLLPDERETRRIHRLLAAPVSRGALAGATFGASMLVALALAIVLAFLSLPLVALAGDAESRDAVFRSTLRIHAGEIETAGVAREVEGRLWIFRDNPAVKWTVEFDPDDLAEGDVRGRIRVSRRLDLDGTLKDRVPVGITVEGGEEQVVSLGPDQIVPVTVPAETARAGRVRVVLRRLDPAYVLGVHRESLRFDGRDRCFLPEFALAALGSGLVAALLTALAVAVSTFASAGVATAAALSVGLLGTLRGFLISAARSLLAGQVNGHDALAEPSALDRLAARIVKGVASVTPDVNALSFAGPLGEGDFATLAALSPGAAHFAIGTAVALLAGYVLLRGREYP